VHHDDGHGLGLSIVRAISAAHGASIVAHARDGGGLSVEVTFPGKTTTSEDSDIQQNLGAIP
jgi:signal transduction histidine kinase